NGVLWAVIDNTGVLRAYDASNITRLLYANATEPYRDAIPGGVRWAMPTVVNGKVYVATSTGLSVFGLLPSQTLTPVADSFVRSGSFADTNYGALGVMDVLNSGNSPTQ